MAEPYISNQIAVYKNSKVLLEFQDKLQVASLPNYGHIHADGEPDAEGRKRRSLIGILMKDYSRGTGDKAVTVTANISPDDARYLLSRLAACIPEFAFQQDKIFGQKDQDGYCTVTKVRIIRATKDKNGTPRKIPWYVEVENGKGIPQTNANGGTYMKSGSFISSGRVNANLTDQDLFRLLSRVSSYISRWEAAIAPSLIKQAKKALEERRTAA